MKTNDQIRMPAVSGMFYPSNPHTLSKQIEGFFEKINTTNISGSILSLIVPHAGYMYSGCTAAHAYSLLKSSQVDTVIILSPSHREWFSGVSIFNGSGYRTPLGIVKVNHELREELSAYDKRITISESGHRDEHAIEVQLPFLQYVVKDFSFLPMVFGDQDSEICLLLGEILADTLTKYNAVVIASSDLSHYHAHEEARQLDEIAANDIKEMETKRFLKNLDSYRTEACGGRPIAAAMTYAIMQGADKAEILYQCTSAETSGDTNHVVGYLSAVLYKQMPS